MAPLQRRLLNCRLRGVKAVLITNMTRIQFLESLCRGCGGAGAAAAGDDDKAAGPLDKLIPAILGCRSNKMSAVQQRHTGHPVRGARSACARDTRAIQLPVTFALKVLWTVKSLRRQNSQIPSSVYANRTGGPVCRPCGERCFYSSGRIS